MSGPLETAREVLRLEAHALHRTAARLDGNFELALEILLDSPGKVILTGIGKSGLAARVLSATFCAMGVPSVYLHPAEAVHGDLGVYSPGDPTILISNSGATEELTRLVPLLRRFESKLVVITGQPASALGLAADAVLDASVEREADPHDLVPTASVIAALAVGHALAVAMAARRGFSPREFGALHPGGQLGWVLNRRVGEVMHSGVEVPWVRPADPLKQALIEMTRKPLGAACALDGEGRLAGLLTDGDLRRAVERHDDIRALTVGGVMTQRPVVIGPDATLRDALRLMEDRPRQLSVLPVVDETGRALGLLRLHDLFQAGRGAV
ncbi:MAG: KpsF/GutQ family sugar-phosphate isomerase [Bryobacteraceae bacterium]|nr:KpsF/GutQ family sugar-phosphate isomerase [Bryobacteraceae bacterium]